MRRDKHEGSISRMPNGKIRMRLMINGKVFSHTADTKPELNKWRRELIMQVESGVRPRATRMTVTEAFAEWYEEYKGTVRPSTVANVASAIRMWNRLLPGTKLTRCTKDTIHEAVECGYRMGYTPRTMVTRVTIFGMMANWAIDKGYILRSPTIGVRILKDVSKVDRNVVDYAERIIDHIEQHSNLMAARCKLLFYTGIRVGEMCGLKWSDIDLQQQSITISRQLYKGRIVVPKTNSSYRTITIPDIAMEVIRYFQTVSSGDYVISTRSTPCSTCAIANEVHDAASELGFEFTTHWFRHAHASFCLHHGMNIAALSARLGHASISTTLNVYSHVLPGADNAVREMWAVKKVVKKVD